MDIPRPSTSPITPVPCPKLRGVHLAAPQEPTHNPLLELRTLTGCLMDDAGSFKEGHNLDKSQEEMYKKFCMSAETRDNDETKAFYAQLCAIEINYEAREARRTKANAHTAVDGRMTAKAMIKYLQKADISIYLEVVGLLSSNCCWLAAVGRNAGYQRLLEAEKEFIRGENQ